MDRQIDRQIDRGQQRSIHPGSAQFGGLFGGKLANDR